MADSSTMLRFLACSALAFACTAGLQAQTEQKTKSKVEIKGGKEITTTGCVDRMVDGRYELTGVEGESQYILVGKDDVAKYLGHRVQIRGRATDLGDAQIKTETSTTTKTDGKGAEGERSETTKTEHKGSLSQLRLLGVDSIKTLANSCN